jgi:hypothetical protein
MTDKLPPMLLNLFAPRPPLRWVEPPDHAPEKRCTPKISGVGQYLQALREYKDNDGYVPTDSWLQKRDRKKLEKKVKQEKLLREVNHQCTSPPARFHLCAATHYSVTHSRCTDKPSDDPKVQGDAFKTLFVSRLAYGVTSDDLEREFGRYGPIERIRIVEDITAPVDAPPKKRKRGYAFIVYEREKDMKAAYKETDGIKSRTDASSSTSSAAAPCLAGVLVDLVVVSVDEATPRVLPLAAHPVLGVSAAHQLAPEALEAVVEASRAAALEDEVAVAAVSVVIEALAAAEVEAEASAAAAEEEEDLVVAEAVSDISQMVTVPLTALPPVHEAHEKVVSAAAAAAADEVDLAVIVAQGQVAATGTIDVVEEAVVGMTVGQAVRTTSLWAAETGQSAHATAAETVGMVETMAHESVGTKATATTIRDNEGGIKLLRWLRRASVRVCQGYLPFFRLIISRQ